MKHNHRNLDLISYQMTYLLFKYFHYMYIKIIVLGKVYYFKIIDQLEI